MIPQGELRRVRKSDVIYTLQNGCWINILGMAATLLGLQVRRLALTVHLGPLGLACPVDRALKPFKSRALGTLSGAGDSGAAGGQDAYERDRQPLPGGRRWVVQPGAGARRLPRPGGRLGMQTFLAHVSRICDHT